MVARKLRLAIAIVASLAATVTLAGCFSFTPVPVPAPSDGSVPTNLKTFYDQTLEWSSCAEGMLCAEAAVPLDYANPDRESIEIALIKHPAARGADKSLGSLFVNPGGPGASGVNLIRDSLDFAVGTPLSDYYDIVGFDPRGVGASTAVSCLDATDMDQYIYGVNTYARGEAGWLDEQVQQSKDFAAACEHNSGDLLQFVDTISAARDLDILRQAVGDPAFNYLGYSYGTLLGATYADLFPTHVGRMVLDGAMDPASSNLDVSLAQAKGFENALRAYLVWCFVQSSCPFDSSGEGARTVDKNSIEVDGAMQLITELLTGLETQPRESSDGRFVTSDVMLTAIIAPLYSQESWQYLSDIFTDMRDGYADSAIYAADWYYNRNDDGTYADNSNEANTAINCIDYPSSSDRTQWKREADQLAQAAPVVGPYLAYGDALCSNWPAHAVRTPAKVHAIGAPDILVIGTVGDPATPYQWAVNLAEQMSSAHLITYEGEGHTAYNGTSDCINFAVQDYLLKGKVPMDGLRCSG